MNGNLINEKSCCKAEVLRDACAALKDEGGNDIDISYRLIELQLPESVFLLVAECNGEYDSVAVGNDKARAEAVFLRLSENGVTPCVLTETVRDLEI